jgi:hypothetical protein
MSPLLPRFSRVIKDVIMREIDEEGLASAVILYNRPHNRLIVAKLPRLGEDIG